MATGEARPRIGILGSARLGPTDPRHGRAVRLGGELARAGHVLVTGGYGGLMAAVSQGAHEAGGSVVGLPMRPWTDLQVNEWVGEPVWSEDFFERLRRLAECDVLVALGGGIGTLSEAAVTWANLQTDPATTPALILVGPDWEALVAAFREELVIDERDLDLVHLVADEADVPAAVGALLEARSARAVGRRFG
jgi:uncharacterized protein (TIGR00725 family)